MDSARETGPLPACRGEELCGEACRCGVQVIITIVFINMIIDVIINMIIIIMIMIKSHQGPRGER